MKSNFIMNFARDTWRFFMRIKYNRHGVVISKSAIFNDKTFFGGNNRINDHTDVTSTIIGRNTYVGNNVRFHNCEVGCFCSIGSNITVINGLHPTSVFVSTSPMFYSTGRQCPMTFSKENIYEEHRYVNGRNIIIGNDVWIGNNVTFMSGITIGDGAVVAYGAVVTKDIPPYAIVGGVPAKVIKYRFTEEQREILKKTKWWCLSDEWILDNLNIFHDINVYCDKFEKK